MHVEITTCQLACWLCYVRLRKKFLSYENNLKLAAMAQEILGSFPIAQRE